MGLTQNRSPVAICGHSLGGRIALQYSHDLMSAGSSSLFDVRPPQQTWILDSVPGTPDPSVHNVINAISSIPLPISSKSDLSKIMKEKYNFHKSIAMWMASNLKPTHGGYDWIFDLNVANELLCDFDQQNFYEMIQDVTTQTDVHLVMAGKNKEWSQEVVIGLENITRDPVERFQMHRLEKAGHWVHVDDLGGLLYLMVGSMKK